MEYPFYPFQRVESVRTLPIGGDQHDLQHGLDNELVQVEDIPVSLEEPWTPSWRELLQHTRTEAETNALTHHEAGYRTKHKHRLISFIVLTTSTITLILSSVFPCARDPIGTYLLVVVSALNVFWNALMTQFDLRGRSEQHFEYEVRNKELMREIDYETARGEQFRTPADAFMTYVKERSKLLDLGPEPPNAKYFFC